MSANNELQEDYLPGTDDFLAWANSQEAERNRLQKELAQLRAENAEMREALEKISNCPEFEDECYRLARAVLAKYPEEEK